MLTQQSSDPIFPLVTLPGEECPFMCNGLTCQKPYGHQGMHRAIHRPVPGVSVFDADLAWDDMWCDVELQKFVTRMVLQDPNEEGRA